MADHGFASFLKGNPDDIILKEPLNDSTKKIVDQSEFIHQLVNAVTKEFLRQEHKSIIHDTIFMPAIQQFALMLRPWLLLLSTIFLILLIIGVFQLILLFTRKQFQTIPTVHKEI